LLNYFFLVFYLVLANYEKQCYFCYRLNLKVFFLFYQLFLKYPLDLLLIFLFRLKIIVVFKFSEKDEKVSENTETVGQTRNMLMVLLLLPQLYEVIVIKMIVLVS